MPDTPKPLACGHDPSEIRLGAEGADYCLRCEDIRVVDDWLEKLMNSEFTLMSFFRGEPSAIGRELARLRAERDEANVLLKMAPAFSEAHSEEAWKLVDEENATLKAALWAAIRKPEEEEG